MVCHAVDTGGDEAATASQDRNADEMPGDPLKDVREGINQAPFSMEFWIMVATVLCCFGGMKYLESIKDGPQHVSRHTCSTSDHKACTNHSSV